MNRNQMQPLPWDANVSFPPFRLDLLNECLWRDNSERICLPPKPFRALKCLVENPGQLVTKQALLNAVWPETYVSDAVLKVCIGEIRKALRDSTESPRFIQTVHRRGYRFIGALESSAGTDTTPLTEVAGPARLEQRPEPAVPFETHYARSGNTNIAYQVIGDGPLDLVFVMGWVSHLEYFWKNALFARFLRRLASFSRLILFDKRGTGLSDRVPLDQLPTLEQRMEDVHAVMDAAGSKRAAICGISEGGPMSALFAATYPERTKALVMIGTYARRLRDVDYPWGPTKEQREEYLREIEAQWGGPVGLEERAPSMANDVSFREWWAEYLRMGASPGAAVALTRMNAEIDIRPVLPSIRVPALVIHRSGDRCLQVEEGRYVADGIPGARFLELPGNDHLPFVGDQERILDEIEEFLTGVRHARERGGVLGTVLFIEGGNDASSERTQAGQQFVKQMRREVEWFRGNAIDSSGRGPLAIFDGPVRAVRCACAIAEHAERLGMSFRASIHTGECDSIPEAGASGPAVRTGREILKAARTGEILVSRTVRDLVAGSGLQFSSRGSLRLSMFPGELLLLRVERYVPTQRQQGVYFSFGASPEFCSGESRMSA